VTIDVLLGDARAGSPHVANRIVIVIDVLRAATSVAVALSHGARAVRPFLTVEAALAEAAAQESAHDRDAFCLAGERHAVRIAGFDIGNSPLEMTRERVEGKTMLFTTTNGTAALAETRLAPARFFAAFVNVSATVQAVTKALVAHHDIGGVTIVCAGQAGTLALEDVVCAGRLARQLTTSHATLRLTDRARVAVAAETPYRSSLRALATDASHAVTLASGGFAADVEFCLQTDGVPLAVHMIGQELLAVASSEARSDSRIALHAPTQMPEQRQSAGRSS
jgi:2-phosphosulfolactate phosphatase